MHRSCGFYVALGVDGTVPCEAHPGLLNKSQVAATGPVRERLQRPAEPVAMQQHARHREQFLHRRAGGPAGDVI
jgi:hypothetical protein